MKPIIRGETTFSAVVVIGLMIFFMVLLFPWVASHYVNATWMGFLSSYAGSIAGGLVGGIFTYGAIYITMNAQNRRKFVEEFPAKFKRTNDLLNLNDSFRSDTSWWEHFLDNDDANLNWLRNGLSRINGHCKEVGDESINIDITVYKMAIAMNRRINHIIEKFREYPMKEIIVDDLGNTVGLSDSAKESRREFIKYVIAEVNDFSESLREFKNDLEEKFHKVSRL